MKKIIVMIMMLLPMSVMASVPELTALIEEYSSNEEATVVNLNGEMLQMAVAQSGESLNGMESMVILTAEQATLASEIAARVDKLLPKTSLKVLTDIKDEGAHVRILANKNGESLSDIVMYITEGSQVVVMIISGEIPESLVSEIISGIPGL